MADPTLPEAVALPPKEAIAFFRQKTNQTTDRWTDVWNEAHSQAFSVAGAASADLVADFRREVARALEQGTSLAEFRKGFDAIVAKHGWSHTGSPGWRAGIIYETNLSTAYSAGRYVQMTDPDVLEAYPFWRYQHNAAIHPRLTHLGWDGLTLRADDPWWQTHYPPNGWRCHCSVSPVSERGLSRMGKSGPDKAPPLDMRPVRIRTADGFKTVEVPKGIDPSFGYNPGMAWQGRVQPGQRLPLRAEAVEPPHRAAAPRAALAPARPPASVPELQRFLHAPAGELPVGVLHPEVAEAIGAQDREVRLSAETAEKQLARHPDLTVHDYAALAELVAAPELAVADGERHVILFKRVGRLLLAAVKRTADGGETYVVSLFRAHPKDLRRIARRGRVLLGSLERLLGTDGD